MHRGRSDTAANANANSDGAAKAKLFALEHKFAMLVRLPDHLQPTRGSPHLAFIGSTLTWLQALQKTSGEVIKKALLACSAVSSAADSFDLKSRVCTSDAHGGNLQAEQRIAEELGGSWSNVHFKCNAHVVASMHNQTFACLSDHIRGLVNFSLSLSQASALSSFRRSLGQAVKQRLKVIRGYPPVHVQQRREFLLNVFCGTGRRREIREHLLRQLPNGDWTQKNRIEVYVAPEAGVNLQELEDQVVEGLVSALSGKLFTVYSQSRWLGADLAVDEVGLCMAVHSLAQAAYGHMLNIPGMGFDGHERHAGAVDQQVSDEQAPTRAAGQEHVSFIDSNTADPKEDTTGDLESGVGVGDQSESLGDPGQSWAQLNTQRQAVAWRWLQQDPFAEVLLIRRCLQPLTKMLRSYIGRSGGQWEQTQRAQEARSVLAGEKPEQPRLTSMLAFAFLTSENEYFDDLMSLRQAEAWQQWPEEKRSIFYQNLAFKVLSKMGGLCH